MRDESVSVVIPARDAARFIGEALRSVVDQDPAPDEVIVADNGSTDATAEIARGYGRRVRVLRLPRAGGPPTSRNAGIRAARGTLIGFLDADDVWAPGKLHAQIAALRTNSALGYVLGRQRLLLQAGTTEPRWARAGGMTAEHVGHFTGALLIRREVLDRVGPFREQAVHAETADWFLRAQELGVRGEVVPQLVVYKRVHEGNLSGDQAIARHGVLRAIKDSLDRRRTNV